MTFCYADPPYIGCAKPHYADDPSGIDPVEVDMSDLIKRLCGYESWALSSHSPGLKSILPLCPDGVRVAAWVKPFSSFKPNVNPAYAWEPIIFFGARKRERTDPTITDWVSANITLQRGTHGAKPEKFCWWLFELIGLRSDDEFIDLFPGSGAVTQAWSVWSKSRNLI